MKDSQDQYRIVIEANADEHPITPEVSKQIETYLLEAFSVFRDVRVLSQPVFIEIPAICPDCESRITCEEVSADRRNGAKGQGKCTNESCGWSGRAVYRLIDVETPTEGINRSAVVDGTIKPQFTSYG